MGKNRVFRLLLLIVLVFAVFGAAQAQEEKSIRISVLGGVDLETFDPTLAGNDVYGIQVANMLFPGLTVLNETTIEVEPGIATYTVSDDGLVYTFSIIPEIPWVRFDAATGTVIQLTDDAGNPRFVTAADVVYGWRRTLTPATGAPYSYVLAPAVVGGEAAAGADDASLEAALDAVGIRAVDTYTVEITAPGDFAYLPNIYGMWMARPVPQWAIEEFGDAWIEPQNIASYGPWVVSEWLRDESITFIPNPFWTGTESIPAPRLTSITNLFLDGSAALANYEAGLLDYIAGLPPSDIDRIRVQYPDQFQVGPGQCTLYYAFNNEKPPFDNVHARRAFSIAIDRAGVTAFTNRGEVPAAFFTRPEMVAAPRQEDSAVVQPLLLTDPEARRAAALAELDAYFAETGLTRETMPAVTLVVSSGNERLAEVIQNMWLETLGINVTLEVTEGRTLFSLRATDAPQIYRASWCFDYPDANNWTFEVFRSDNAFADDGGNEPNYASAEFDRLVNEARLERDTEVRRALYQQAEELLTFTDAAIAPIYYFSTTILSSPRIDRPFSFTGYDSFEKWDLK